MSLLWKIYLIGLAVLIGIMALGFAAQAIFGCHGDPKSYRACFVAGVDIAGSVFAAQYLGLIFLVWLWLPLALVIAAISARKHKR